MDVTDYAKFLLALIFVLGLIGLLTALARRWGLGLPGTQVARGGKRRIGIVEVAPLDTKRRLVLIKRDDTEHLIILGHEGETVIETGITPPHRESFSETLEHAAQDQAAQEQAQESVPEHTRAEGAP